MNRRGFIGLLAGAAAAAIAGVTGKLPAIATVARPDLPMPPMFFSEACPPGTIYFMRTAEIYASSPLYGAYITGLAMPEGY